MRNVTKATADVSKPEQAKCEGLSERRCTERREKMRGRAHGGEEGAGMREERKGRKEKEEREIKRRRRMDSKLPEIRQYPQRLSCAAG